MRALSPSVSQCGSASSSASDESLFAYLDALPEGGRGEEEPLDSYITRLQERADQADLSRKKFQIEANAYRIKAVQPLLERRPPKRKGRGDWEQKTAAELKLAPRTLREYLAAAAAVEQARLSAETPPVAILARPIAQVPLALRGDQREPPRDPDPVGKQLQNWQKRSRRLLKAVDQLPPDVIPALFNELMQEIEEKLSKVQQLPEADAPQSSEEEEEPPSGPSDTLKFSYQNEKLKRTEGHIEGRIRSFNLPAWKSEDGFTVCPGAGSCRAFCYARKGWFGMSWVKKPREHNLQLLRACGDDVAGLAAKLSEGLASLPKTVTTIRLHDSGDFYSQPYLEAWLSVIRDHPHLTFYTFTKSVLFFKGVQLPENFKVTYSEGGKFDAEIPPRGSRARVFLPVDDLSEGSGWVDGGGPAGDLPAIQGEPQIGLRLHGVGKVTPSLVQVVGRTALFNDQLLSEQGVTERLSTSRSPVGEAA